MYIMPSCFSDNPKSVKEDFKENSPGSRSVDSLISDNPTIFRICCCCIVRRRKRVDTAKQNGTSNHAIGNSSDETVLNIDQIEFSPTTPITCEK